MAKIQKRSVSRAEKLLGHSCYGYGNNISGYLSSEEKGAYKNICISCQKAVNHPFINANNFISIIYVYKNYANMYKPKTGNFFALDHDYTQDEFIEYIVRELLTSGGSDISGFCVPSGLRIVASITPINVNDTKTSVSELVFKDGIGEIVEVERGLELLGEYFLNKDDVVEKHAFKPRKLKKPKSTQKRLKNKSKSKSLKNKSKSKSKKSLSKSRNL